jgi:ATP-binding cassette subfamily B (MDR/TAP) protein 1
MKAFETIDVSEANFFSLMFFVVALANFAIYAAAGWVCNEIGQVSSRSPPDPQSLQF